MTEKKGFEEGQLEDDVPEELTAEEQAELDAKYGTFQNQFFAQEAFYSNEEILDHILFSYMTQPDSAVSLDHYSPDGKMVVQLYNIVEAGETTRTETIDWFYVDVNTGEYTSVFFGHKGTISKG